MKITVIHGQNHKGSTWHVAEELLNNIQGEKEVTEFYLPRDLDHFCLGCYACVKDDLDYSGTVRASLGFMIVNIIACLISIPYWSALGYI